MPEVVKSEARQARLLQCADKAGPERVRVYPDEPCLVRGVGASMVARIYGGSLMVQ